MRVKGWAVYRVRASCESAATCDERRYAGRLRLSLPIPTMEFFLRYLCDRLEHLASTVLHAELAARGVAGDDDIVDSPSRSATRWS
jgi:hypothetical protein